MKKFTLHLFFIFIISLSLIMLSSCGNINENKQSIYDDDGKIVRSGDSYNYVKKSENSTKYKVGMTFGTFNGMDTLWRLESEGDASFTIEYDSEIDKGKFKCVLISPDDEVINIFEQSEEGIKTYKLLEGTSRIKIVGNNAGGAIAFVVSSDEEISIQKVD